MREDDFWRLTPAQMASAVMDRAEVLRREHDNRVWLAWHTAAFGKSRKLPALQKFLAPRKPKPRRRQSWEEQLRIMDQWVAVTADPSKLKRH